MMSVHLMWLSHANTRQVEQHAADMFTIVSYRRRIDDYGLWLNRAQLGRGKRVTKLPQ